MHSNDLLSLTAPPIASKHPLIAHKILIHSAYSMSRIPPTKLGIPGLNKKPAREVKEEDLLDDIEASTKRLYQQVVIF